MVDPVTVWVANGRDGCYAWETKPYVKGGIWDGSSPVMVVDPLAKYVPLGGCVEYVMIPASEYREMQRPQPAELSPVAKLIAELSHQHYISPDCGSPEIENSVNDATQIVKLAIATARDIESEVK